MRSTILLETKALTKIYVNGEATTRALENVSIEIYKGSFVSVMGKSGSGKTTLLNMLGCLDVPSSGEYWLNGTNTGLLSKKERSYVRNTQMGFIFQSFHLLPRTSALENVELPLIYSNPTVAKSERRQKAEYMLELVGLADKALHYPNQLSGGQQQRVAIARALINNPPLLLADEATGNLDSKTSNEIMDLLSNLNSNGKTIVFVTHNPEINQWVDRVIVFEDGHIISDESKRNLQ